MVNFPTISFNDFRKRVEYLGFNPVRQKGFHIRYVHEDGRKTTIPVHGSKDVPKGLLFKIIRYDIGINIEEFFTITK
ncbi:MAG: type II toxin-antitoxin system HicA family toxin, partial [Spirochaetia bacterium]